MNNKKSFPYYTLILPVVFLGLYGMLMWSSGPFYLTRIDPDYVYLLSGMNCSDLHFDRIGHIDHPGTPFQIFLGILIRIIHVFSGQGIIVDDVLTRPEHYMRLSSHILGILLFILMIYSGYSRAHKGKTQALTLQSSVFLSSVIADLSIRIMPDRFGFMLTFLMVTLLLKYMDVKDKNSKKLVLGVGLLTGLAIATKILFLPIIFLPLFVISERRRLFISILGGFLLGVVPIFNRFGDFRKFLGKIISHDGLYGSGEDQFLNVDTFFANLGIMLQSNSLLYITCFSAFITAGYFLNKLKHDIRLRFIYGFLLAVALATILVAKHFKNYYLISVLILIGPSIVVISELWGRKAINYLLVGIVCCFSFYVFFIQTRLIKKYQVRYADRVEEAQLLAEVRRESDYLLVKPEWTWGPSPEYGLVFGFSYVRHRHRYAPNIKRTYNRVLTYEGNENDLRIMRVDSFSMRTLDHQNVLIVDQPQRNAGELLQYLKARFEISKIDSTRIPTGSTHLNVHIGSPLD